MIVCLTCGMPMTTWDDPIYDPLPVRFRMLGRCDEKECEDHGLEVHIKSRDGNYWFVPPYSNRGVTSSVDTSIQGGK